LGSQARQEPGTDREQLQRELRQLSDEQNSLRLQLDSVDTATRDTWESMTTDIENRMSAFERSVLEKEQALIGPRPGSIEYEEKKEMQQQGSLSGPGHSAGGAEPQSR
jgi:predicted  nucleic acid-binding Zn-ribbon protein